MSPDRRQDPNTRERVDALHDAYMGFASLVKWLLGFIAVAQIATGIFVVVLLNDNSQRITDIQASRLASCLDTNRRHDATVGALQGLRNQQRVAEPNELVLLLTAAGVKVTRPKRLKKFELSQVNASYESTLGLIDTLSPHRNCAAVTSR